MSIRTAIVGTARLAALAVVLLVTVAQAEQYSNPGVPTAGDGMSVVRSTKHAFKISGHIKNLYPGRTTKLATTIRNPNREPIRVTHIKAKVTAIPGCPAKHIKIKPFNGKRYVGAGHSAKVKLTITMRPKAPNSCRGARLHLSYHGKAVRA